MNFKKWWFKLFFVIGLLVTVYFVFASVPNFTTEPSINSTYGLNLTNDTLWCNFIPTGLGSLTADVMWLKNNESLGIGFFNQSGGFAFTGIGAGDMITYGIATNGSDFWIGNTSYIMHYDRQGNDLGDGFSTVGAGSSNALSLEFNDSELWVLDFADKFVYHLDLDGNNLSGGFTTDIPASATVYATGFTMNETDFWIISTVGTAKFVYHLDADGNNISGGFKMPIPTEWSKDIDYDSNSDTFWISYYDYASGYAELKNVDHNGNVLSTLSVRGDSYCPRDLEFDDSELWISDVCNDFIYHFKNFSFFFNESITADVLNSFSLTSSNTSKGDNWSCQVKVGNGTSYSSWVNSSHITILEEPMIWDYGLNESGDLINKNVYVWVNASDDFELVSCNFTISSPSFVFIDNENATSNDGGIWNSSNLLSNETGVYYWNVTCYDNDGLTNFTSGSWSSADARPPDIQIDVPVNNTVYSSSPSLDFWANDDQYVSSCKYTVNSGVSNTSFSCSGSGNVYGNVTLNLADGSYDLVLYVTDLASKENFSEVSFSILTPSPPSAGGGGGAAPPIMVVVPFCGDGECQPENGENIFNCHLDCATLSRLKTGEFFKSSLVVRYIVYLIIILFLLVTIKSETYERIGRRVGRNYSFASLASFRGGGRDY